MHASRFLFFAILLLTMACRTSKVANIAGSSKFDLNQDLLLVQYDCKTDVDDLHSVAAFATLISNPQFANINYHAVAGTYGTQDGLYVPPYDLMQLVFGDNWSDANQNFDAAIDSTMKRVSKVLNENGDIWIAEAGQSDFSAGLIRAIQQTMSQVNTKDRVHIVQHSDWNEKVTDQVDLLYAKQESHYQKIPDGNTLDNGTPGFRDPAFTQLMNHLTNKQLVKTWHVAIDLSNTYNGKEGRYLNKAIKTGGLDFSDFSEVCWILNLSEIRGVQDFFLQYAQK